jgi:hypothetical protein
VIITSTPGTEDPSSDPARVYIGIYVCRETLQCVCVDLMQILYFCDF